MTLSDISNSYFALGNVFTNSFSNKVKTFKANRGNHKLPVILKIWMTANVNKPGLEPEDNDAFIWNFKNQFNVRVWNNSTISSPGPWTPPVVESLSQNIFK